MRIMRGIVILMCEFRVVCVVNMWIKGIENEQELF